MDRSREMGRQIRDLREAAGLTVEELSRKTRISSRYVRWIEEGDLGKLPGGIFVSGFVRSLCLEIGCDHRELLAWLEPEEEEDTMEQAAPDNRPPVALAGTIAVLILLVAGAFFISSRGGDGTEGDAGKAAVAAQEQKSAVVLPEENALPVEMDLVVRAIDNTWLKIQADDGEPWETSMKTGDEVRLKAMDSVSLYIGNAGGLMFELNGKNFGPPGKKGQVIKNYVITRDNL